jgi:flagellar basal body-associated protein FliL
MGGEVFGDPAMKLKRIHWVLIAAAVIALAAVGAFPSYSFVSVTGPDGNLVVQKAGFGNNGIHVQTDTADIRVNHP